MARKFFYAWQSERPGSVCRNFIRNVLDLVAAELQQAGIDERVEIDSDTQNVPGVPEIVSTIFRKIEEDDVFVADLTMCSETSDGGNPRRSPNANVMFEYGYALRAKTRDRIICVMNTFYGGTDPAELPFDLRHARAPFRYSLAPGSSSEEKTKVRGKLHDDLLEAARLIVKSLPSIKLDAPRINFENPHFAPGQEITPEGDFAGQENPTFFNSCSGFVYLRGLPLEPTNFSIAQIHTMESQTASLEISCGNTGGSFGTNKWGRICYGLYLVDKKRMSSDYVQYFRTGEIEEVNGSYLTIIKQSNVNVVHVDYLVTQIIMPMLAVAKQWLEKTGIKTLIVDVGIIGIEGWRITLDNYRKGPMIHVNKISAQKAVGKESILDLAEQFRITLLAEAGLS